MFSGSTSNFTKASLHSYLYRLFFNVFSILNFGFFVNCYNSAVYGREKVETIFSSARLCQQSYCRGAGVRRPPVRKLRFLGNRCMDPGQSLWVAPSPPYLHTIFFFFQNFHFFFQIFTIFVFVNMGPYGSKPFKTLLVLQFSSI